MPTLHPPDWEPEAEKGPEPRLVDWPIWKPLAWLIPAAALLAVPVVWLLLKL